MNNRRSGQCGVCPRGLHQKPTAAHGGVLAGRWWCAMNTADRIIRWSTALAVLGVAVVAAVASYEHAYDLVRAHGEADGLLVWSPHSGRRNLREFDGDA